MNHLKATSSHKKIVAGIAAFAVLFIVLFSSFYICAEADHHCSGEDCPVCACIQICENVIRQMGSRTDMPVLVPFTRRFCAHLAGEVHALVFLCPKMRDFTIRFFMRKEVPVSAG